MKKRYIVMAASCLFVLVAGVCYSCSYGKNHEQSVLLAGKGDIQLINEDIQSNFKSDDSLSIDTLSIDTLLTNDFVKKVEVPMIYVHLCGAVVNPDVYQVKAGTRLVEIIEIAGGLVPEAAGDYMNQAMVAEDGQRIYIPTNEELEELDFVEYVIGDNSIQAVGQTNKDASEKVNINTADETELMSLPGIGQAKAKSIIEYRNSNGSFKATDDIMDIPGIKEGLFGQIKELITVK